VVLSGWVQINTLNQNAGKATVSLRFKQISGADIVVQEMSISSIAVGGSVSGSKIVTTGSIGRITATELLDSDILVGAVRGFDGPCAQGAGDFGNAGAKLGNLTITGKRLPKGSSYPAYVRTVQLSAPSVGTLKLANVDSTAGAVQVHVLADTGTLAITALKPVMDGVSVLTAGSWKAGKAGRPTIWEVV
jgi:hypothetical protein